MFHYVCTVFRSPGVALPSTSMPPSSPPQWTAMAAQGGVLGWNAVCNVDQEKALLALYGPLNPIASSQEGSSSTPTISRYFPSPEPSFCQACQIWRPPRCRHCSVCQRCVLQFDHHCVWVNQCIGYNNYRHFVLMLFFFMTGCWYGVALLFQVFYEPFRAQIREHGFKWLYSNGTGLLDIPMPHILLGHIFRGDMPAKMVIDVVYPLLLGIGAVLSWFLGFHVKYMTLARTTLEHSICLEDRIDLAKGRQPIGGMVPVSSLTNPYDQGYLGNLRQILGSSVVAVFLPIIVTPPPPYRPQPDKSK